MSDETRRLSELEQRVRALRDSGAAGFDGPALRFVEVLLARAHGISDGARERVLGKAEERIERLRSDMSSSRERAERELARLSVRNVTSPKLVEWVKQGDYRSVALHAGRMLREAQRPRPERARPPESRPFRAAAAHARAIVVVARATDRLPDVVGPYNPLVLAVRTLRELADLAPAHLASVVSWLEDLAALAALPEVSPKAAKQSRNRHGARAAARTAQSVSFARTTPRSKQRND